jgi:hypothetical protein
MMDWQSRDDDRNADPDWQADWHCGHEIGSLIVRRARLGDRPQRSLVCLGDAGCSGALPGVALIIAIMTGGPMSKPFLDIEASPAGAPVKGDCWPLDLQVT